jgi:glycosyltransferase involved in cell wall biosynthesis
MNLLARPISRRRPIRIFHLIAGLETGGTEMMLYKVLSHLNPELFKCKVLVMIPPGPLGAKIASLGIPVESLRMTRSVPNMSALFQLVQLLRQERPDVLQTWMYHADLLGGIAGKMAGIRRVVWNVRQSANLRGNGLLTTSVVLACGLFSRSLPLRIICNSRAAVRIHENLGYTVRRMRVIPNGFDLEMFAPDQNARSSVIAELGLPLDSRLLGHVARLDPAKDHENLFSAFRIVASRNPKAHLLCVGRGVTLANKTLAGMANKTGFSDRCHLLGERLDIPRLTAALDIALSSSYAEGFPNSIGEAMACGVPCVATNVGDSASLVGDSGRVVEARRPAELAQAICSLLELSLGELGKLGESARNRVRAEFAIKRIAEAYEQLYQDVVRNVRHHGIY